MSSRIKDTGNKRRGEFNAARIKLNLTDRAFFLAAANEANMANERKKGGEHIDPKKVANDFANFQLADSLGRFEAPRYVHEKIARTLRVKPETPPRPKMKGRFIRQRSRFAEARPSL